MLMNMRSNVYLQNYKRKECFNNNLSQPYIRQYMYITKTESWKYSMNITKKKN
jgi:hypothetical protein